MTTMQRTLGIGAACVAGALLMLATAVTTGAAEGKMDGKEQFMSGGCNTCHAVASADIAAKTTSEKMFGGDLGGYETDDLEALAQYVRKQTEMDGKSHKKEFKGTDEELQAIVDWLGSLEAAE